MPPGVPPYPPPGGPRHNNKTLLWVLLGGGAALVALLLVVLVLVVVAKSGDDGGGQEAAADSQSAVVKKYLQAVAAGDADAALALAQTKPLTRDFLTDEVLKASKEIAPITNIQVGQADSEYDTLIPATFRLGDQTITEDFSVVQSGSGYRLRDAATELDLTNLRSETLPMLVNGKEVTQDKILVFPGAYRFTTGSQYVDYGTENVVYVKSNNDYTAHVYELQPTLNAAGRKAFTQAVEQSTMACLRKHELAPHNCPNHASNSQSYRIDKASIRWTLKKKDAFANLKPSLDYDNPAVAAARPNLSMEVRASCNSASGQCSLTTYSFAEARVDMTKDPLTVHWSED